MQSWDNGVQLDLLKRRDQGNDGSRVRSANDDDSRISALQEILQQRCPSSLSATLRLEMHIYRWASENVLTRAFERVNAVPVA